MSDDLVWVTTATHRGSRKDRKLHTDRDCRALAQAESISGPKPRSVFDDDREDCGFCAGEESEPGGYNTEIRATIADPDFGPEDLGLSPMDERGDA